MSARGLDELIGRLIWVGIRGRTPGDLVLEDEIKRCERAHVGGIILFDVDVPGRNRLRDESGLPEEEARLGSPRNVSDAESTARLVKYLKERLGEELIVSIDQEGGFVSRLNPRHGYPASPAPQEYASLDAESRSEAARTLAETISSVGIDLNLAPCVDVAINPDGPGHTALGRSFGRDPESVARMAGEQIDAMHHAGAACMIKHFPGHGSAVGDTHFGLVDITQTWAEEDELAPYARLLGPDSVSKEPADAVMISHLIHRGFDADRPASLSHAIITGLLRERLGYDGLVTTDSLDMHAVADRFDGGEAAVLALEAGADVALEANNLTVVRDCPAESIHTAIADAVADGRLSVKELEQKVARAERVLDAIRRRRAVRLEVAGG
ncbi:MAG: glycoside hydrolase family 3 N-terminal domain-containing protein [Planctomycetota bacterium]